jgi:hypothetical protein
MGAAPGSVAAADDLEDDALLTELGVEIDKDGIAELKHVRSTCEAGKR